MLKDDRLPTVLAPPGNEDAPVVGNWGLIKNMNIAEIITESIEFASEAFKLWQRRSMEAGITKITEWLDSILSTVSFANSCLTMYVVCLAKLGGITIPPAEEDVEPPEPSDLPKGEGPEYDDEYLFAEKILADKDGALVCYKALPKLIATWTIEEDSFLSSVTALRGTVEGLPEIVKRGLVDNGMAALA